jgi:serine/threonine protein kinase
MEEIQNEVRAVTKLCLSQPHENIVKVVQYGMLSDSEWPYYFFDMELCEYNLDTYIHRLWTPSCLEEMLADSCNEPIVDPKPRMRYIWVIMAQITNGIVFVHKNKEVHRDLKPRNGVSDVICKVINM